MPDTTRAELVSLTRAQQRYMGKLLTKSIYPNRFGDDTGEDGKTSIGALAQMVRYMIDQPEPYDLSKLLDVLLQQFPSEALCEELRDHPLMEAANTRSYTRFAMRQIERIDMAIEGIEVAPIFLPCELRIGGRTAQQMTRQLSTAPDAASGWIKLTRPLPMAPKRGG